MSGQRAAAPNSRPRARFWWAPLPAALVLAGAYHGVVYSSTPSALANSPGLRVIGAPLLLGAFAGLVTRSGPATVAGGFITLALAWYAVFEALRCIIFRERRHRARAYVLLTLATLVWLWAGWVTINWNPD